MGGGRRRPETGLGREPRLEKFRPGHLELRTCEYGHLDDLTAVIFDVDGVLLASPHERAWRDALQGLAEPDRFTTAIYEPVSLVKPRLAGARAALDALGVPDGGRQALAYAKRKQKRLRN